MIKFTIEVESTDVVESFFDRMVEDKRQSELTEIALQQSSNDLWKANDEKLRLQSQIDSLNKVKAQPNTLPNNQAFNNIVSLISENHKIFAIKATRDYLACGLKEAKDFVEMLMKFDLTPNQESGPACGDVNCTTCNDSFNGPRG